MFLTTDGVTASTLLSPRVPVVRWLGTQVGGVALCSKHPLNVMPLLAGGESRFLAALSFKMFNLNVPSKAGFALEHL